MTHRLVRPLALLFLMLLVGLSAPGSTAQERAVITPHEAEIILYLLPVAHQLRSEGMDVGWELQEQNPDRYPKDEYYVFWLVNNKRTGVAGSSTIGYFAVSKYTGDIWNSDLDQVVTSTELEGVQRILRRAHGIDEKTVK